jgi:hypothetical protein
MLYSSLMFEPYVSNGPRHVRLGEGMIMSSTFFTRSALMFTLSASLTAPVIAGELAPVANWRLRVPASSVSGDPPGAEGISGLVEDLSDEEARDRRWPRNHLGRIDLRIDLSAVENRGPLLVVLELEDKGETPIPVVLGAAKKPSSKKFKVVDRKLVGERREDTRDGPRVARLTFPGRSYKVLRLVIGAEGRDAPKVESLRLYRLDKRARNDYWLFLGAGITKEALNPRDFARKIVERYADRDPYVCNESVGGWNTREMLEALPDLLKEHRHAHFVAFHIGGADVSDRRPFPRGSRGISRNLEGILRAIVKAGKVPILARLTYRAYHENDGKPAVPPEENGSGPYVEKIYDPLIAKYCPHFYDRAMRRGAIDFYSHYRTHPEELSDEGVSPNDRGRRSMRRIWLDVAGGIIYGDGPIKDGAAPGKPDPGEDDESPTRESGLSRR